MYDDAFFDRDYDRRDTASVKWERYAGLDVLPFWIADMDFASPDFIIEALHERLDHPIIGYAEKPQSLYDAFVDWLAREYGWQIDPDWIVWIPGVVPGFNLAALTLERQGSILIPTPVYHPFLWISDYAQVDEIRSPMTPNEDRLWEMDFAHMRDHVRPDTRMLLFCNPQNPTGRCYRHEELSALKDIALDHDLIVVSDEIHCGLVLDPDARHIPIAGAFPEIQQQSISLFAATKTYNTAGLGCAAAVIPNAELRESFTDARAGVIPNIGPLALVAAELAFRDTSNYVPALRDYLRGNYAMLREIAGERLAKLEGTYLAWLDVRDLAPTDTDAYFQRYGLGVSPGLQFGHDGYMRFNFACPRPLLAKGLERLTDALGQ